MSLWQPSPDPLDGNEDEPEQIGGGEMSGGEYVRSYYKVPANRGMRVVADGKPGTIVGFDGPWIKVRLDGEEHARSWHPTWRIEYPEADR